MIDQMNSIISVFRLILGMVLLKERILQLMLLTEIQKHHRELFYKLHFILKILWFNLSTKVG